VTAFLFLSLSNTAVQQGDAVSACKGHLIQLFIATIVYLGISFHFYCTFTLIYFYFCLLAVPMDLDVKAKAILLGACFLIVSFI